MHRFLFLFLLIAFPTTSSGEFYSNRGDWNRMTEGQKLGYVAGVLDRDLMLTTTGDESGENQRSERTSDCLVELGINTGDLVQLVGEQYQDIEKWDWPPYAIVLTVAYQLCKDRQ